MISVIVLLHNLEGSESQERSELCVEGLFKYASLPFELILVNNGSTDNKTSGWFNSLKPEGLCENIVKLDRNKEVNTSFSAGANAGIKLAKYSILAFINNDIAFNDSCLNWMDKMNKAFNVDERIMLVGINPLTFKKAFDYGLDSDKYVVLFGFTLMKKSLIDYIGYFDEQYLIGMFDDDDLNVRLRRMGFKVAAVNDIKPVHDWSSSTIEEYNKKMKSSGNSLFEVNRTKFNNKWRVFEYKK